MLPAPVPPRVPKLPASGGELYSSLMRVAGPAFNTDALHHNGKIDWSALPGAMDRYSTLHAASMQHLSSSMHTFVKGVTNYTEHLSRASEEKDINGILTQIQRSKL